MTEQDPETEPVDLPPILGSWPRMYAAVLIAHLILIVFFYLFSTAYV